MFHLVTLQLTLLRPPSRPPHICTQYIVRSAYSSQTTTFNPTRTAPYVSRARQDPHLPQHDVPSPIPALPRPAAVPDRTADTDDHDRGIDVGQA